MAFTTWSALKTRMLDDLASGKWMLKSYTIDGVSRTFVSIDEFMKVLEYAERKAAQESGGYAGRTYAKQGGGGRW